MVYLGRTRGTARADARRARREGARSYGAPQSRAGSWFARRRPVGRRYRASRLYAASPMKAASIWQHGPRSGPGLRAARRHWVCRRRESTRRQTMGKITGFLEIDRQEQKYAPASDRVRHFREFAIPLDDRDTEKQAARCMDCGIPYCHTGCPVNNQIPDWNDLVYHGQLARRRDRSPFDQQLPGIHRPHLPGTLRGGLHAQSRECAGHHQDDRAGDRRQGLVGRLDQAGAAGREDRQERRDRGLGLGRHGRRTAIGARRSRGPCLRDAMPRRAGCCAMASPTSRWRSIRSTAASSRWKPKASPSTTMSISA